MFKLLKNLFCLNFCCLLFSGAYSLTFDLPEDGSTLIGAQQEVKAVSGDTLSSLGRRYSLGIFELVEANPGLDLNKTYDSNQSIVLPTEFLLPNAPHRGIVINLAELRLYFYVPNTKEVRTFPVGIGRQGWDTPLGETYIAGKTVNPTWIATDNIKAERLKDGVVVPDKVGPGPDNPLGPYKFRLGLPLILLHGSNDPAGIGRRSSSGCIRMQPEDIESIFNLVDVNLPVIIVDEPVKIGWHDNKLYLESHVPLEDDPEDDVDVLLDKTHSLINATIKKRPAQVDWSKVDEVVREHLGYPIQIGEGVGAAPIIIVPLNPSAPKSHKQNAVQTRKTTHKHKHLSNKKTVLRFWHHHLEK